MNANDYIITDLMLCIGFFLVGALIASPIAYRIGKREKDRVWRNAVRTFGEHGLFVRRKSRGVNRFPTSVR